MECEECGRPLESTDSYYLCSPVAYTLNAEPGELRITGYSVGMVMEGPLESPDGRRVDSMPASGGRAYSRTDSTGAFTAELSDPLDRGRPAERHALKVLIQALQARGDQVILLPGGRDDRGEDGLLSINGRQIQVQVVSLPAEQSLWRELSLRGTALRQGTNRDAVELIRQALVHKKGKAARTLLVLDAAQVGAIIGPSLVMNYHAVYGDPEQEFSLVEAWIVGATARSAIRLGVLTCPSKMRPVDMLGFRHINWRA
jgi:hypothetical protein